MTAPKDGLIVIRKEAGWTSFDVVAVLRRVLGTRKVGHTGTLDPEAAGVLPVVFGRGTKLVDMLTEHEKQYRVVCRLGVETDTQDMTGTVVCTRPVACTGEEAAAAALSFIGEQEQLPPMYSALKVGGKRLYELARAGEEVERKPRKVNFSRIEVLSVSLPLLEMEVTCSKGTYIRTLCHDLGARLGCGGAMESLLRTRSGAFTLSEAHTIDEVRRAGEEGRLSEYVYSLEDLLGAYPALRVLPEHERLLRNGNRIPVLPYGELPQAGMYRVYLPGGEFVGLYGRGEEELYSVKMLCEPERLRNQT